MAMGHPEYSPVMGQMTTVRSACAHTMPLAVTPAQPRSRRCSAACICDRFVATLYYVDTCEFVFEEECPG